MNPSSFARGSLRRAAVLATGAAVVLSGLAIAGAAPASASTSVSLTGVQSNGQIGVPQNLVVTAAVDGGPCGSIQPPDATILGTTGSTVTLGTATFSRCVGNTFQYTFQWLPSAVGGIWISAQVADGTANASRSQINAVSTTTRVTLANTVQLGTPTTITASVTANSGSLASPQGAVQFSIVGGGNIGGPVQLNGAVPATVQIQWTPAVLGSQSIIATYIPSSSNFTCGNTCVSAPDTVQVTSSGVKMYLANSGSFSAGAPSTITAVVSVVPPSGTVRFTVNGSNIGVVPVGGNGQAQIGWTPPSVGTFTIGAFWNGAGNLSSTAQEVVNVGATPASPDQIRVVTATGTVLTPGTVYQLGNGTVVTFTATTASGAPVTFNEDGPCTITANTFTVTQGNGQCRVTGSSPGGNGYAAATATVTVNLVPGAQTTNRAPRASGRIDRGTTVTLVTAANNVTNAGQRMTWRVTSGSRFCELRFPSNGNIRLRAVRPGTCDVRATAPAVSGQWNRLVINRSYRVR